MSLYQDPSRLVWIGTRSGGVSRWNPRSWEFGGHRPKWFGSSAVTAFAEAANGRVWIASRDGALVEFDPRTGEARTIEQVVGRRKPLGDTVVMSLRQDHLGNLWIGTMSEGVKKLTSDGRLDSIPVAAGESRCDQLGRHHDDRRKPRRPDLDRYVRRRCERAGPGNGLDSSAAVRRRSPARFPVRTSRQ